MNNMINLHKIDKKRSLWYNDIVRVIRGYGKMKGYVLEYVCENEFKKLERALKKYNMLAFKKLNFDYLYDFDDLKNLSGRKFRNKRNKKN